MPSEEEKSKEELELELKSSLNSGMKMDMSDPNHFLYLHHSDHPNYSLATQLLSDSNYHQWRRAVEVSLTAKNKLVFVTGDYKCPDCNSGEAMQWKRCDSMVIAWLIHSVEKEIAETLLYYNTSAEIWSDLRLRFGQPSMARTYQVQKELFNISQGNMPITAYYTKFKKFWDEYLVLAELPKCNSCGVLNPIPKMILNQQVLQFLVGLNESYTAVRANALMMKPTPLIGEVYQMALQEEKQRGLLNNSSPISADSSAFSVFPKQGQGSSNSNQPTGQNFNPKGNSKPNSGQYGGSNSNNSNSGSNGNGQRTKPYYFCENCKVAGHSISKCFKIHGYPKDWKDKKFAGNTTINEDGKESIEKGHSFTKNQYERLLALLDHQHIGGSTIENKSCMMAGPFNEQSSGAW